MMSPPQVPGAVLESSSQNPQGYGYPSKRMRLSPSSAQPPGQNDDSPTSTTASTYQETTSPADSNAALPYPAEHTIPTEQPTGVIENRLAPKTGSSSFRNVSACNRCRLRKNRCDQRLPSCSSCSKAGVRCVGYDPITKREIPRSYVYYLETRVEYLEGLLRKNGVPYDPAEVLNQSQRAVMDPVKAAQGEEWRQPKLDEENALKSARPSPTDVVQAQRQDDEKKLDKLVSNVGMISVAGASDPRYLGSTSGISFARVVFAAVKSSVSGANSDKGSTASSNRAALNSKAGSLGAGTGATSMRDSFFGLQTKPTIKPAPFPDRYLALRLVNFYFEHANPQVPILHRGEFMRMFDIVYGSENHVRTPRESYMLNIVFAIGAGIYLGDPDTEPESASGSSPAKKPAKPPSSQQRKGPGQAQPEEYHASAIVHLEACLQSTVPIDRPDGFGGGLEELQAVLLLAGFALLRPVAPGLWYIVGVAVRLAVDLGLHYEDGKDIDSGLSNGNSDGKAKLKQEAGDATRDINLKEKGRREWIRDFRRRLWWCTYSYDRLVSTCVGRPFGITDQVITTEFPSLLEDQYLTPGGFLPEGHGQPSSKHVAYHYFRFRLLQSEILQVLQHQSAQFVRASVPEHEKNRYMHAELPSPFLIKHGTFRNWRIDIDKRLWDWKESAPTKRESGVKFSHEFLELNYWQAIIMLYRQSLSVPKQFENELRADVDEVESPTQGTGVRRIEAREDEERVFLKVAEAGQKVLRLYRMLHRVHLVNYTFLATHHLFMAGISFLYAIWHSPVVRSRLTMDEVDFTILAATSVLGDLVSKCPPAEACRDAFERMSKATVTMCMTTSGFSSNIHTASVGLTTRHPSSQHQPLMQHEQQQQQQQQSQLPQHEKRHSADPDHYAPPDTTGPKQFATSNTRSMQRQPSIGQAQAHGQAATLKRPQFDMALNDLYAPSPQLPRRTNAARPRSSHKNEPPTSTSASGSAEAFAIPRSNDNSPAPFANAQSNAGGPSPPMTNFNPRQMSTGRPNSSHGNPSPPMTNFNISSSQMQGMDVNMMSGNQQYMPTPQNRLTPTNLSYLTSPFASQQQVQGNDMEVDFSNLANFSHMDFLNDSNPQMGYGNGGMNGMGNGNGQVNLGGLELGFGWGAEGEGHDFSEGGNQLDFFDGFYFGAGVQ